jgi:hypothetical protein
LADFGALGRPALSVAKTIAVVSPLSVHSSAWAGQGIEAPAGFRYLIAQSKRAASDRGKGGGERHMADTAHTLCGCARRDTPVKVLGNWQGLNSIDAQRGFFCGKVSELTQPDEKTGNKVPSIRHRSMIWVF